MSHCVDAGNELLPVTLEARRLAALDATVFWDTEPELGGSEMKLRQGMLNKELSHDSKTS